MAQRAVLHAELLYFLLDHLVLAGFALGICSFSDRTTTSDARREVDSALCAIGVIGQDLAGAGLAWTGHSADGRVLRRVAREDRHCQLSIGLTFVLSQSLQVL